MMYGLYKNLFDRMQQTVYIAGACANIGRVTAQAGYAIYFGEGHPKNEYGPVVDAPQRKYMGYVFAFVRCLEILGDQKADIFCDTELNQKAYTLYKEAAGRITLNKISVHTGFEDEHSRANAAAHKLAHLGANDGKDVLPCSIRLNIPYANKDKAKELGAMWNAKHKTWYINTRYVCWQEVGERLLALQTKTKRYIKIPYANKDRAKKLGAWWDAAVKSWYYVEEYMPPNKVAELLKLQKN
jgi:hypothetical protein